MLKNVRVNHELGLDMSGWFSKLIVSATIRMPKWFVGWVSRRYVAGNNIDDAVKVMTRLSKENACFTIDVLGEEISTLEEANFFYEEYVRVVNAIIENKLDANLSIKPTAFGLLIDRESGFANIKKLVKETGVYAKKVSSTGSIDFYDHTGAIFLINRDSKLMGLYTPPIKDDLIISDLKRITN